MFDEIDKNNFGKNVVSLKKFLNDDNKIYSMDLEKDQIILLIEEEINEKELILDGIKFKGIEDIKKDPFFLQIKNLKDIND